MRPFGAVNRWLRDRPREKGHAPLIVADIDLAASREKTGGLEFRQHPAFLVMRQSRGFAKPHIVRQSDADEADRQLVAIARSRRDGTAAALRADIFHAVDQANGLKTNDDRTLLVVQRLAGMIS